MLKLTFLTFNINNITGNLITINTIVNSVSK